MPEQNTNRDLDADQVVHLFAKNLPSLVPGLGADRTWLWWSGDKPSDRDRATLLELGFRFTPRPHTCEDGRVAHWYHACGGAVIRRHRGGKGGSKPANRAENTGRPQPAQDSDAMANLMALADRLP